MPRNRYTKLIRKSERAQLAKQVAELAALEKELHGTSKPAAPLPVRNEVKEKRGTRLAHKRRHKPERGPNVNPTQ
ncbi:hypothetical protein [Amycolatopsis samaneae]|uniref:Transposase n=1 Tax=Amycolatopsis samaneae TaxID=664691 RepID=A0ABW5GIA8_9PSEU